VDKFELRQCGYATVPAYFLPGYWMTSGPTSDPRFREAMDIAINREELVESFFKGFGKATGGQIGMSEAVWGFNPIWYSPKYEPDRARQLLNDAGYPGKFQDSALKVYSTSQGSFGWEPDYVQVLAGYWQAVGINTQIKPIDYATMRTGWIGKDPQIMGS